MEILRLCEARGFWELLVPLGSVIHGNVSKLMSIQLTFATKEVLFEFYSMYINI